MNGPSTLQSQPNEQQKKLNVSFSPFLNDGVVQNELLPPKRLQINNQTA